MNTISPAGTGLSLIRMPGVGALPDTVQVTPFASSPGFCNLLTVWATAGAPSHLVTIRDVGCYNAGGGNTPFASLITYTAAH